MQEERPSPEELLKAIKTQEAKAKQGKLKIFLGMAAGVGKTYAMLEDAHEQQEDGLDVVVGIVDTHGRQETAALLAGLQILAPAYISYKNKTFQELDLDAILKLKPDYVLVDELAHSNVPGSRHQKRWQDVMELLDKGIDVSTTLNVQHIESLNDVVKNITGIAVQETVPDNVVERATYIELVDLTPTELLQRLKEGKVYLGEQSKLALENFFKVDRLTALREIVLRFTAERVDHELHTMAAPRDWKPRERLLVVVNDSPHSLKLIRTTKRLAFILDAPWIALHVDDGRKLDDAESAMLTKNLDLARELGAEVISTQDPDIANGIERIAEIKRVSQIIVGRAVPHSFFSRFRQPSLLDRLATECSDIDVHVLRQKAIPAIEKFKKRVPKFESLPYFFMIGWVFLLTFINLFLVPYIGYKVVGFTFLLGILASSLFFTKGPIFLGTILYAITWDYLFVPPLDTFVIGSEEDSVLLALYISTALVIGSLIDRERKHKEMLAKRELSSQLLYEIVREIATTPSTDTIVDSITIRLNSILPGRCEFFIKDKSNTFQIADDKERACALWVFDNEKEAGVSTTTSLSSKYLYIPLKGHEEMVGVLRYHPYKAQPVTIDEKNLIYSAGQQLSFYLERTFTEERERTVQERAHLKQVYQSILQSIITDTADPLSTLKNAIQELENEY